MLPVLLASLIALVGIKLDWSMAFTLFLALTISYARKDREIDISSERYLNFLLLSAALAAASFSLPSDVIFAAIFASLAHEFRGGPFRNLAAFTALGFAYLATFHAVNGDFDVAELLFVSLAGALAASLVESVESRADKRITVLLALATTYTVFRIYIPEASLNELAAAFALSLALSLIAAKLGVADESGLLSATLAGTLVILFADIRFFVLLLLFYALGSAVTKYRYEVKLALGIAEPAGGARGYANVLGNSLAAVFFAVNYGVFQQSALAAAFAASVAAALADTMASEVGKTAKKVYLITNFKPVRAGESGGVSLIGELAAISGCVATAVLAALLGILALSELPVVITAAFAAVHVDSVLGATLEKIGLLTNSAVNLLATLFAGVLCYLLLSGNSF